MHKVTNIRVTGFRRLNELNINMRPLMVLIGANGAGKTSILDALLLLSSSAAGKLNVSLNSMGGIADVSTRGQLNKKITLEVEMDSSPSQPWQYKLELEARGQGYSLPFELLSQQKVEKNKKYPETIKYIESSYENVSYYDPSARKFAKPNWELNPLESALSQAPKMYAQTEEFRRTLSSVSKYHVLDVGSRAPVKLPQQMKPALFPGMDGEDLVPFLYNLRESDSDRYEVIEDTLRAAFPGFEGLNFPPVAAGMLSLTWKEKQFRDPIYVHQLSEGTLRFLWLVSLLQSPNLSTITMIDEPEISMHPELLNLLAELLREASKRTQIIVATHSDRLIRFLEPKEVVAMDIDENGFAQAQWADTMDLEKWLVDYTLDEVWSMGRMGARAFARLENH